MLEDAFKEFAHAWKERYRSVVRGKLFVSSFLKDHFDASSFPLAGEVAHAHGEVEDAPDCFHCLVGNFFQESVRYIVVARRRVGFEPIDLVFNFVEGEAGGDVGVAILLYQEFQRVQDVVISGDVSVYLIVPSF